MRPDYEFVEAFKRNCPKARLNLEELGELRRLFQVCQDDATEAGRAIESNRKTTLEKIRRSGA